MRHVREILRQKWRLGRSHREVAASLGVSVGVVSGTLARAREAGLGWPDVAGQSELEVEARLYQATRGPGAARPLPDFARVHTERQRPGVTLELLHLEYREQHPEGYGYTQFCASYRRWCERHRLSMRQIHRAGEKLFVDYAGKKPTIVDPETGEAQEVELFVAVLGASSFTYAEATRSQRSADFLASHTRALEFFGGVPALVVPDQLKSGVTGRAATSRGCSGATRSGPSTTGRPSCRRARESPGTRRRSRWVCRWWSAGSWRGFATRPSSRSQP